MLFLAVLGGAAVLEVHRALHHGGNGDVNQLKEKEAALRKQLQVGSAVDTTLQQLGCHTLPSCLLPRKAVGLRAWMPV